MAATAVPVSQLTATMHENVEYYPHAIYPVGSTSNPLAAVIQALGVYAENLGRRGKTSVTEAGVQAIGFAIAMPDADYNIQVTFVDADGVVVPGVVADYYRTGNAADRTVDGFNVTVQSTGTLIWWVAAETD